MGATPLGVRARQSGITVCSPVFVFIPCVCSGIGSGIGPRLRIADRIADSPLSPQGGGRRLQFSRAHHAEHI